MSKAQLLEIANINVFPNDKPQVTFLLGKDKESGVLNKIQADYSGWEKEKFIDLKAINAIPKTGGKPYIRIAIALGEGANRSFVNGALFKNNKKVEGSNQPDYTGSLDMTHDRNGEKLNLAAWNKTGRESGKPFISISITEPQANQANQAAAHAAATPPADNLSKSAPRDMDDDIPF